MKTNDTIRSETQAAIHGVPGRFNTLRIPPAPWKAGTFSNQTWVSESRPIGGYSRGARIQVEMRFDDNCKNGHNDFAITAVVKAPGERDCDACGCLHDDITEVFPELAHLIKWHLTSTEGPFAYVGNTTYLAGDRDCWGLRKGESRQIVNGRTGKPSWIRKFVDQHGNEIDLHVPEKYADGDAPPPDDLRVKWVPWCRIGEGKGRQLDAARSVAAWPEATDEQLCLPEDELTELLKTRLPARLVEFLKDIEACGFMWECPATEVTA